MKTPFILLLAAAVAVIVLPSCQSTGGNIESVVMCDKCKTVWVKSPATINITGRAVTEFREHPEMQCPDCEKGYVTFLRTGSLKHHCSHCGGTMSHCAAH